VFIQKSIADKMGCGVPLFSNAFLMVSCAISQKVEEVLEAQLSCARMSLLLPRSRGNGLRCQITFLLVH
jgi:hypothetical protein